MLTCDKHKAKASEYISRAKTIFVKEKENKHNNNNNNRV